jgi:hypothetical protein
MIVDEITLDEFDYWEDAYEETIENINNVPFLSCDGTVERYITLDYSITDCISLQFPCLRRYGYENRFYFVTSFLLRESLITSVTMDTLRSIDQLQLQTWHKNIRQKYVSMLLENHVDEFGNNLLNYLAAMDSSFLFPSQLCRSAMTRYWQCAIDFHTCRYSLTFIENCLIEIRPANR